MLSLSLILKYRIRLRSVSLMLQDGVGGIRDLSECEENIKEMTKPLLYMYNLRREMHT